MIYRILLLLDTSRLLKKLSLDWKMYVKCGPFTKDRIHAYAPLVSLNEFLCDS